MAPLVFFCVAEPTCLEMFKKLSAYRYFINRVMYSVVWLLKTFQCGILVCTILEHTCPVYEDHGSIFSSDEGMGGLSD